MSSGGKIWFSAVQLGALGAAKVIPDMPRSEKGAREAVKRMEWLQRRVECQGGKGGMRTEYQPPAAVLALIYPFLEANPEFLKPQRGKAVARSLAQDAQSPEHVAKQTMAQYGSDQGRLMAGFVAGSKQGCAPTMDAATLNACHEACRAVYGEAFDAQSVPVQIEYAVDLYNLQVRMSAQNGGIDQMKRLEIAGMMDLLKIFIRLGWARKFPPPPHDPMRDCFF